MKIKITKKVSGCQKGKCYKVKRISSNFGTPPNPKKDIVLFYNRDELCACFRNECTEVRELKRRVKIKRVLKRRPKPKRVLKRRR